MIKNRSIKNIANAHGIDATDIFGNDCEKIYEISKDIIKNIRKYNKPHLLKLDTYRHLEHCGPNNDDDLKYRDNIEVKNWLKKDPIESYKKKLLKNSLISQKDIDSFSKKIKKEIDSAFNFAKKSAFPNKKLLKKYIYA